MDKPFFSKNLNQILERVKLSLKTKESHLTDYGKLFTNDRQDDLILKDPETPVQSLSKW